MNDLRYCPECNDWLPPSEFYTDKRGKDGLTRRCRTHHIAASYASRKKRLKNPSARRDYNRSRFLLQNYGITLEDYEKMWSMQDGRCAICGQPETALSCVAGEIKRLAVDHNAETGQVRELLCGNCNVAIGHFRHKPELLRTAALYLEKHSEGISDRN